MNQGYELPNGGGVTISTRLAGRLMEALRGGEFAASAKLPAETELAARFGVSRSVVRDALATLERAGVVERGRGVGTVVNRQVLALGCRLDMKFEYNDFVRAAGGVPGTDSVKVYAAAAEAEVAQALEVDVGEPLVVCEKRILASGRPVIWSIDHLPGALFEGDSWQRLDWARPVFDLLWEERGIAVDSSLARLGAVVGPGPVRRALGLAEGEALMLVDEVGYFKLGRPVLHSSGFYTSYFDFTLLRKRF